MAEKVLLLVGLPIIFELTFVLLLSSLLSQSENFRKEEHRARSVYQTSMDLLLTLMEAGSVTVIKGLAGQQAGDDRGVQDRARALIIQLKKQVDGHPREEKIMNELQAVEAEYEERFKTCKKKLQNHDKIGAIMELKELRVLLGDFVGVTSKLKTEVGGIQDRESARLSNAQQEIMYVLIAGVVLNVGLGAGLATYFNQSTTRRLNTLTDNTARLASGDALNPPIGGDDELTRLDACFTKMAEDLRTAARKERAIVENAVDVICSVDADGNFSKANHATEKAWGVSPLELQGKHWNSVISEESRTAMSTFLNRLKSTQQTGVAECAGVRQDGKPIHMSWAVQWSEEDQLFFCVVHDVSEKKEIENLKRDFVAMVSHDLRSPLTSIGLCLNFLAGDSRCGTLTDLGNEKLNVANANIERLIKLVNDLLDIEKLESGQMQLDLREIELADVVEQSIFAVESAAAKAKVELDPVPGAATVLADSDRLVQVLINLLSNAIKFSPEGSKVQIRIVESETYGEVRVIDQGRGIPIDKLESVFERFKQVTIEDAKKRGGSGLGLAICKSIVENHSGIIGVESKEGEGSTFWFRIPRSETTPAQSDIDQANA